MRLFVALDLDETARTSVAAAQQRLKTRAQDSSRLRWVRPEHLHMTLVFLGEVPDTRADEVVHQFAEPEPVRPFAVVFRGFGAFPPHGAPRALWIGVSEGEREIRLLQAALAARARRLGIDIEEREFSPHLTLGRWKDSRPSDRRRILDGASDSVVARVHVGHVTLYRSQLSSSGPSYTPLAHVTLSGRD